MQEGLWNKVRHASRSIDKWAYAQSSSRVIIDGDVREDRAKKRDLVEESGLQAGIGFPTGCSLIILRRTSRRTPEYDYNTTGI